MTDRAQSQTRAELEERVDIARVIALHGLGMSDQDRRGPPNELWTIEEWNRRVLECIPERVEERCYALADAIILLLKRRRALTDPQEQSSHE